MSKHYSMVSTPINLDISNTSDIELKTINEHINDIYEWLIMNLDSLIHHETSFIWTPEDLEELINKWAYLNNANISEFKNWNYNEWYNIPYRELFLNLKRISRVYIEPNWEKIFINWLEVTMESCPLLYEMIIANKPK